MTLAGRKALTRGGGEGSRQAIFAPAALADGVRYGGRG
jgi:hypothetical protein